jgi:hypothetical protein
VRVGTHLVHQMHLVLTYSLLLPVLQVVVQYKSAGRPLQEAQRVWAHVGHSGWQFTEDVELFRSPHDHNCWTGIYRSAAAAATAGIGPGATSQARERG